mmetsp:Transcript_84915/g.117238  ORF Transcript_84915/g.117238 Transcript_84915/m.117238 type:complete len:118 (-) Transcript_84915:390-743(-)
MPCGLERTLGGPVLKSKETDSHRRAWVGDVARSSSSCKRGCSATSIRTGWSSKLSGSVVQLAVLTWLHSSSARAAGFAFLQASLTLRNTEAVGSPMCLGTTHTSLMCEKRRRSQKTR